ncbi:MAG TPA: hypothetical protein VIK50_14325 [Gemmatimonadaceae bacterium]
MLRVTRVLTALLLVVPLQGLTAQISGNLLRIEGQKVRMRVAVDTADAFASSIGIQGTVFEQRGDSIQIIEGSGRFWTVPLSRVQSLDVSHGRDRWRGAGVGALAGVALGLLISMEPPLCDGQGNGIDCRRDGTTPSTAQYVGDNIGIGVFVGAIVGAAIGVERWERLMTRPRMSVAPGAGGIGLRLTY